MLKGEAAVAAMSSGPSKRSSVGTQTSSSIESSACKCSLYKLYVVAGSWQN